MDAIRLTNLVKNFLDVTLDKGPQKADWAKRGYAHLFYETILQADEGCDFDFMRAQGKN